MSKEVIVFPYINIEKIIKMGDLEIHPILDYPLNDELNEDEILTLTEYKESFRNTLFNKGEIPEMVRGVGILKYKGTILRTTENSSDIGDKIKILFLLLKLHVSIDFFNSWMSVLDVRVLNYYGFNVVNKITNKFGNGGDCETLYSTVPENIKGLKDIVFYPLEISLNNFPVTFSIVNNSEEILGIDSKVLDVSSLYCGINTNEEYYKKFLNISSVHNGLEQQNDLFFYYAIIPSILEVLIYDIKPFESKKQKAVDYGRTLDSKLIKDNDYQDVVIYTTGKGEEKIGKEGLITRTIISIYDMRNDLLHEGKKSFEKMKVDFKGCYLSIYDIFQLIFKYSILNDFISQGIIKNNFTELLFEGDVFTTGNIKISAKNNKLYMDDKINGLFEKSKSDKELKQGLYIER